MSNPDSNTSNDESIKREQEAKEREARGKAYREQFEKGAPTKTVEELTAEEREKALPAIKLANERETEAFRIAELEAKKAKASELATRALRKGLAEKHKKERAAEKEAGIVRPKRQRKAKQPTVKTPLTPREGQVFAEFASKLPPLEGKQDKQARAIIEKSMKEGHPTEAQIERLRKNGWSRNMISEWTGWGHQRVQRLFNSFDVSVYKQAKEIQKTRRLDNTGRAIIMFETDKDAFYTLLATDVKTGQYDRDRRVQLQQMLEFLEKNNSNDYIKYKSMLIRQASFGVGRVRALGAYKKVKGEAMTDEEVNLLKRLGGSP